MPAVAQPAAKTTRTAPRRKAPLVTRRRGRRHEEDEDETAGTEESYTDDSGLSGDDSSSDDESDEEYEEDTDQEVVATGKQLQQQTLEVNGSAAEKRRPMTDTEVMNNGAWQIDQNAEAVDFEDTGDRGEGKAPEAAGFRWEASSPPQEKVETAGFRWGTLPPSQKENAADADDFRWGTSGLPQEENVAEAMESRRGASTPLQEQNAAGTAEFQRESSATPHDAAAARDDRGKRFETPQERKRREHEEYKKRRAEDPSFVPNRGRFFMHDHRHDNAGNNGFRPGRGRGGRHGEFHAQPPPPELAVEWPHDMHEQVEEPTERPVSGPQGPQSHHGYSANAFAAGRQRAPDQPRSFGRTLHKGTVQIQVNLPGMKAPITFSEVPWKAYTRLPYHRPPLRRDKPVRIAIPDAPVRYIYPSAGRSFIFIPRAMRPGGSGYIRGAAGRGRGGYPIGRSMYGGGSTIYSPSVGLSRRSSLQYDTRHHTPAQVAHPAPPVAQPTYVPDPQTVPAPAAEEETSKPVVRLPSAAPPAPTGPSNQQSQPPTQAPTPRNVPPHQPPPSYTPSINPIPYRETRATPKIPMYQPRPQKAVNVAEIDSPHVVHFPHNYSGGVYSDQVPSGTPVLAPNGYAHSRHPSYPSQASGTPLSQIPEAIHARPFHPQAYAHHPQTAYYPPYPAPHHMPPQPHLGFHPPPPPYAAGPSPMPNGYAMPAPPPVTTTGPTTIAQESNGMVYYTTWDPSQYYSYPAAGSAVFSPPGGTPGMPMTPAPDAQGQNVNGTVYYYQQPQPQTQGQPPGQGFYTG